jgi:hypothetical protein
MLLIYLDQNKWIDFSKAQCAREDGRRFRPALEAATAAVAAGKAIFPLTSAHIMETAKAPRPDQRRQLAGLMTLLSRGFVFRAASLVVPQYIDRSLFECFGKKPEKPLPSRISRHIEDAFDFDLGDVLGLSPDRAQALRETLDTPAAWCDLLAHDENAYRMAGVDAVNAIGDRYAKMNEEWRTKLARDDLGTIRRAYAATLTMTFYARISTTLKSTGHTISEWGSLGPERLMAFWCSIPNLHVELELHSQKNREKSSAWERNDSLDIGSLSLAIPTCDVVVTERSWVSMVKKRKLDRIYKTVVISDLAEIEPLLINVQAAKSTGLS